MREVGSRERIGKMKEDRKKRFEALNFSLGSTSQYLMERHHKPRT